MAYGRKTGGRDIKKGRVLNPNGRPPKEQSLTDLMRAFLQNVPEGQKKTYKEIYIQKVYQMAVNGDQAAIKLIWNYIDGMPKQELDPNSQVLVELINYAHRKENKSAV